MRDRLLRLVDSNILFILSPNLLMSYRLVLEAYPSFKKIKQRKVIKMGKTNFEKIKELKEFEAAQVMSMLPMHVAEVQQATRADFDLDAADLEENAIEIITSWLKDPYDEKKGFKMYLSGGTEYITPKNLSHYSHLEDTHQDFSENFDGDEEED